MASLQPPDAAQSRSSLGQSKVLLWLRHLEQEDAEEELPEKEEEEMPPHRRRHSNSHNDRLPSCSSSDSYRCQSRHPAPPAEVRHRSDRRSNSTSKAYYHEEFHDGTHNSGDKSCNYKDRSVREERLPHREKYHRSPPREGYTGGPSSPRDQRARSRTPPGYHESRPSVNRGSTETALKSSAVPEVAAGSLAAFTKLYRQMGVDPGDEDSLKQWVEYFQSLNKWYKSYVETEKKSKKPPSPQAAAPVPQPAAIQQQLPTTVSDVSRGGVACQPPPTMGGLPGACQPPPTMGGLPGACQPPHTVGGLPGACQPSPTVGGLPGACQPPPTMGGLPGACQPPPTMGELPVACQPPPTMGELPVPGQMDDAAAAAAVARQVVHPVSNGYGQAGYQSPLIQVCPPGPPVYAGPAGHAGPWPMFLGPGPGPPPPPPLPPPHWGVPPSFLPNPVANFPGPPPEFSRFAQPPLFAGRPPGQFPTGRFHPSMPTVTNPSMRAKSFPRPSRFSPVISAGEGNAVTRTTQGTPNTRLSPILEMSKTNTASTVDHTCAQTAINSADGNLDKAEIADEVPALEPTTNAKLSKRAKRATRIGPPPTGHPLNRDILFRAFPGAKPADILNKHLPQSKVIKPFDPEQLAQIVHSKNSLQTESGSALANGGSMMTPPNAVAAAKTLQLGTSTVTNDIPDHISVDSRSSTSSHKRQRSLSPGYCHAAAGVGAGAGDLRGCQGREGRCLLKDEQPPTKKFSGDQPCSHPANNQYFCHACSVRCSHMIAFDQHMNSSQHTQRMQDILTLHSQTTEQLQRVRVSEKLRSSSDSSDSREYCSVCDRRYHGVFLNHRRTEEHRRKERLTRKGCILCKTGSFTTYPEYVAHIDSQSHKQAKTELAAQKSGEIVSDHQGSSDCSAALQHESSHQDSDHPSSYHGSSQHLEDGHKLCYNGRPIACSYKEEPQRDDCSGRSQDPAAPQSVSTEAVHEEEEEEVEEHQECPENIDEMVTVDATGIFEEEMEESETSASHVSGAERECSDSSTGGDHASTLSNPAGVRRGSSMTSPNALPGEDLVFDPTTPSGQEFVVPVRGFFCKLCHKFYNNEEMAKITHCKTQKHFEKFQELMEFRQKQEKFSTPMAPVGMPEPDCQALESETIREGDAGMGRASHGPNPRAQLLMKQAMQRSPVVKSCTVKTPNSECAIIDAKEKAVRCAGDHNAASLSMPLEKTDEGNAKSALTPSVYVPSQAKQSQSASQHRDAPCQKNTAHKLADVAILRGSSSQEAVSGKCSHVQENTSLSKTVFNHRGAIQTGPIHMVQKNSNKVVSFDKNVSCENDVGHAKSARITVTETAGGSTEMVNVQEKQYLGSGTRSPNQRLDTNKEQPMQPITCVKLIKPDMRSNCNDGTFQKSQGNLAINSTVKRLVGGLGISVKTNKVPHGDSEVPVGSLRPGMLSGCYDSKDVDDVCYSNSLIQGEKLENIPMFRSKNLGPDSKGSLRSEEESSVHLQDAIRRHLNHMSSAPLDDHDNAAGVAAELAEEECSNDDAEGGQDEQVHDGSHSDTDEEEPLQREDMMRSVHDGMEVKDIGDGADLGSEEVEEEEEADGEEQQLSDDELAGEVENDCADGTEEEMEEVKEDEEGERLLLDARGKVTENGPQRFWNDKDAEPEVVVCKRMTNKLCNVIQNFLPDGRDELSGGTDGECLPTLTLDKEQGLDGDINKNLRGHWCLPLLDGEKGHDGGPTITSVRLSAESIQGYGKHSKNRRLKPLGGGVVVDVSSTVCKQSLSASSDSANSQPATKGLTKKTTDLKGGAKQGRTLRSRAKVIISPGAGQSQTGDEQRDEEEEEEGDEDVVMPATSQPAACVKDRLRRTGHKRS